MANDAGLWPGNQHTDKLNDGHPSTNAMRHSVVAQKATNIAHMSGSKAAHATAAQAHRRALNAHKLALGSATRENRPVHEAYIDAHESAIAHHQIESAPKQEEVEL